MSSKKQIIIVGGGIIGCTTAYYLTKNKKYAVTLIEKHNIACHSSGKAGGLLAKDWLEDELAILGEISFNIHAKFGDKYKNDILYRKINTYELNIKMDQKRGKKEVNNKAPFKWINKEVTSTKNIGNYTTTAQVCVL